MKWNFILQNESLILRFHPALPVANYMALGNEQCRSYDHIKTDENAEIANNRRRFKLIINNHFKLGKN